ncbi:hypothetical protein [Saccharophagus sp. K07]|jgi:hypothetical protein|nr:hypothetical protein [Saccharophagus sp. K07]
MDTIGWIFAITGMCIGFSAYARVGALEKKLKEEGILDASFDSEKEIDKS